MFAQLPKRVPRGVVCLVSALQFHGIGTQSPHQVWLALPRGSKPLSDASSNDTPKQTKWAAFIRGNVLTGLPGHFSEVVMAIRDYLALVLRG